MRTIISLVSICALGCLYVKYGPIDVKALMTGLLAGFFAAGWRL